jgi:hypothetical protein
MPPKPLPVVSGLFGCEGTWGAAVVSLNATTTASERTCMVTHLRLKSDYNRRSCVGSSLCDYVPSEYNMSRNLRVCSVLLHCKLSRWLTNISSTVCSMCIAICSTSALG